MALKLRILGWALFIIGTALLMLVGQFDFESLWTWIGLFVTLAGMLSTSLCNVIPSLARLRHLKKKARESAVEPLTSESAERARALLRKNQEL